MQYLLHFYEKLTNITKLILIIYKNINITILISLQYCLFYFLKACLWIVWDKHQLPALVAGGGESLLQAYLCLWLTAMRWLLCQVMVCSDRTTEMK